MVFVALAGGCHTFRRRSEVALVFFYYFFFQGPIGQEVELEPLITPEPEVCFQLKRLIWGAVQHPAGFTIYNIQYVYIFEYIHMPLGLMEETQS